MVDSRRKLNGEADGESGGRGTFADYLELLAAMGQDFAASLDIDQTLDKALARIARFLDAEAASLFLLESDDRELVCRASYGPVDVTGIRLAPEQGIVGRTVHENRCAMVRDVRLDPDFAKSVDEKTGFTTRSILCAPMSVKHRRVGAIELLNKRGGDGLFADEDRSVLRALASSAALAIINARLTAAVIEQEKLRRELELAAEIQRNLLPHGRSRGFPVNGVNVPARAVSGDFFDIFTLADGRICFNLGDVSGKGINAALLMAKTSSLYHCLGKSVDDPGMLLGMINAELCETGTRGMFVTMVGGVYDPRTDIVRFANAGHEPPLLRSRVGRYASFPAEAPPLGIAPDLVADGRFPVVEQELDGGSFYVFSDGVTEGLLPDGSRLGAGGLKRLLDRHARLHSAARLSAVVDRLHRPGSILHDDVTVLVVEQEQA